MTVLDALIVDQISARMQAESRGRLLNQDNQDWRIQPQRSQRYAEKDLSFSPSAPLCVLRGWTICTNVTRSDLDGKLAQLAEAQARTDEQIRLLIERSGGEAK